MKSTQRLEVGFPWMCHRTEWQRDDPRVTAMTTILPQPFIAWQTDAAGRRAWEAGLNL